MGSPLYYLLWFVKYTFTCQRWLSNLSTQISLFYIEFTNFSLHGINEILVYNMFSSQFDTNWAPFKINWTEIHLSIITQQQISACPKVISDHLKNVKVYINIDSHVFSLGNTTNSPCFYSGPLPKPKVLSYVQNS